MIRNPKNTLLVDRLLSIAASPRSSGDLVYPCQLSPRCRRGLEPRRVCGDGLPIGRRIQLVKCSLRRPRGWPASKPCGGDAERMRHEPQQPPTRGLVVRDPLTKGGDHATWSRTYDRSRAWQPTAFGIHSGRLTNRSARAGPVWTRLNSVPKPLCALRRRSAVGCQANSDGFWRARAAAALV